MTDTHAPTMEHDRLPYMDVEVDPDLRSKLVDEFDAVWRDRESEESDVSDELFSVVRRHIRGGDSTEAVHAAYMGYHSVVIRTSAIDYLAAEEGIDHPSKEQVDDMVANASKDLFDQFKGYERSGGMRKVAGATGLVFKRTREAYQHKLAKQREINALPVGSDERDEALKEKYAPAEKDYRKKFRHSVGIVAVTAVVGETIFTDHNAMRVAGTGLVLGWLSTRLAVTRENYRARHEHKDDTGIMTMKFRNAIADMKEYGVPAWLSAKLYGSSALEGGPSKLTQKLGLVRERTDEDMKPISSKKLHKIWDQLSEDQQNEITQQREVLARYEADDDFDPESPEYQAELDKMDDLLIEVNPKNNKNKLTGLGKAVIALGSTAVVGGLAWKVGLFDLGGGHHGGGHGAGTTVGQKGNTGTTIPNAGTTAPKGSGSSIPTTTAPKTPPSSLPEPAKNPWAGTGVPVPKQKQFERGLDLINNNPANRGKTPDQLQVIYGNTLRLAAEQDKIANNPALSAAEKLRQIKELQDSVAQVA